MSNFRKFSLVPFLLLFAACSNSKSELEYRNKVSRYTDLYINDFGVLNYDYTWLNISKDNTRPLVALYIDQESDELAVRIFDEHFSSQLAKILQNNISIPYDEARDKVLYKEEVSKISTCQPAKKLLDKLEVKEFSFSEKASLTLSDRYFLWFHLDNKSLIKTEINTSLDNAPIIKDFLSYEVDILACFEN